MCEQPNDGPMPSDDRHLVALAALDLGPNRVRNLVAEHGAAGAWHEIASGGGTAGRRAAALDVDALWQRHVTAGIGVSAPGRASFPSAFDDDPEPPPVLFHRGDLDVLSGPRVAIVGTRRCTRYGRDVALELGEALGAAGVSVVSGLALGIDAAAHQGALRTEAPPVAVVGSGLDVVYPRANRALWSAVEAAGLVLSETPLGGAPVAWRFPARNRLIAALADVVVVVESHDHGGSLSTVAEAARRDRPVMAVPGPIRSRASAGCNRLLADGCAPVCDVDDVLVALGFSPGRRRRAGERRPAPAPDARIVLDEMGWQPTTLDQLALRTGQPVVQLAVALEQLRAHGWIAVNGGWFERIGRDRSGSAA